MLDAEKIDSIIESLESIRNSFTERLPVYIHVTSLPVRQPRQLGLGAPTRLEKLQFLIGTACSRGWNMFGFKDYKPTLRLGDDWFVVESGAWRKVCSVEALIYNHDFLRSLFGDDPYRMAEWKGQHSNADSLKAIWGGSNWQFHAQFAVISADPVDYLYKAAQKDE